MREEVHCGVLHTVSPGDSGTKWRENGHSQSIFFFISETLTYAVFMKILTFGICS